jgi:hypothetical protein
MKAGNVMKKWNKRKFYFGRSWHLLGVWFPEGPPMLRNVHTLWYCKMLWIKWSIIIVIIILNNTLDIVAK